MSSGPYHLFFRDSNARYFDPSCFRGFNRQISRVNDFAFLYVFGTYLKICVSAVSELLYCNYTSALSVTALPYVKSRQIFSTVSDCASAEKARS